MRLRTEVADSDDEGSDFGPDEIVEDQLIPDANYVEPLAKTSATTIRGTDSTDQEFFQQVYDEQRVPSAVHGSKDSSLDYATGGNVLQARDSSDIILETPGVDAEKSAHPQEPASSSITDPRTASRTAKPGPNSASRIDYTQVTTPGVDTSLQHVGEEVGIWDSSSSLGGGPGEMPSNAREEIGARSQSRVTKTYGKRKGGLRSSPRYEKSAQHAPDEETPTNGSDDVFRDRLVSPRTARKIARLESMQESPRSAAVVTQTGAQSIKRARSRRGKIDTANSSVVTDKVLGGVGESLYITPSALSASQRQLYVTVNIQPEPGVGQQGSPLRSGRKRADAETRSSAATVPYSTPSRYASSGLIVGSESKSPLRWPLAPIGEAADSSPDVISATATSAKKQVQDLRGSAPPPSEAEVHALPRSVRKRTARAKVQGDGLNQKDSWGPEAIEYSRENCHARPSRRTSKSSLVEEFPVPEEGNEDDASIPCPDQAESPHGLTKRQDEEGARDDIIADAAEAQTQEEPEKKMGRKRKALQEETLPDEPLVMGGSEVQEPPAPEQAERRPAKRKRGRPRRSETVPTPAHASSPSKHVSEEALTIDPDGGTHVEPEVNAERKAENRAQVHESPHAHVEGVQDARSSAEDGGILSKRNLKTQSDTKGAQTSEDKSSRKGDGGHEGHEVEVVHKPGTKDKAQTLSKAQGGKVLYRVGLSKRSRITPLLKSLRK